MNYKKIDQSQGKVSELKQVHGLLHLLEVALTQLDGWIQFRIKHRKALDLEYVEENWRDSVSPQIKFLEHFASKEMRFLLPPFAFVSNEAQGPAWISEIIELQGQFEATLNEQSKSKQRDDKVIADQSHYLLETSRKHLFIIDQQLKAEIESLMGNSGPILQGVHNGSTNF